jgi:hypothetical protein
MSASIPPWQKQSQAYESQFPALGADAASPAAETNSTDPMAAWNQMTPAEQQEQWAKYYATQASMASYSTYAQQQYQTNPYAYAGYTQQGAWNNSQGYHAVPAPSQPVKFALPKAAPKKTAPLPNFSGTAT